MKRFSFLFAAMLCVLLPGEFLHAEEPLFLDAEHAYSNEEAQVEFARLLRPTPEHDIFFTPIDSDKLNAGSHLHIFYTSQNPLPIEFGPQGAIPADTLTAILPASEHGDVLLPLTASPSWNNGVRGIFLKAYGKKGEEPHVQKLRVEDHLSFLGRFVAYLRQPFYAERFTFSTMSELAGYRMGGISLSVLVGMWMILVIGVLIIIVLLRTKHMPPQHQVFRMALITCLCAFFFIEARFLPDLTGYAMRLQREWWETGRLGHAGDVYAIADAVHEEAAKGATGPVLLCKPLTATPLRYLLYPIPLISPEELTNASPALVITDRVWDRSMQSFQCGKFRFDGTLLRMFPDGEALIGPSTSAS
ncbi:MAG TPA: hypothetical protein VJB82_02355 [Candidatus Peribacterales bacterium]|nr:hypothetical protein [Candidatus Peribacterales bacterium]